jgi:hypothetical protein
MRFQLCGTIESARSEFDAQSWLPRADGWDGVLKPVVARYHGKLSQSFRGFHADADSAWNELGEAFSARR